MTVKETFGSRLRAVRREMKLSQEEFAKIGGVKRVSQHLYEQDVRRPDVDYVLNLQKQQVDIGFLLFEKPMQPTSGFIQSLIPLLSAAFRAVDDFARDDRGELLPLADRERFFQFLCKTLLSAPATVDASDLKLRLAKFIGR